jgi:RimJ/RimL family protein N-acetyltransferase
MTDDALRPIPPGGYWQGDLVRLRAMRPDDDAVFLAEEHADVEAVRHLNYGITVPRSAASARAFTERFAEFGARDERLMFAIENLAGELVGAINVHSMEPRHGTFETGTRIYSAYRDRGYAFDAKLLVLRYAFHELRYQKYVIHCLATNQPMVRHAARLGCVQEGRLRRQIFTDGGYRDLLVFGLLREEFDALLARTATTTASAGGAGDAEPPTRGGSAT